MKKKSLKTKKLFICILDSSEWKSLDGHPQYEHIEALDTQRDDRSSDKGKLGRLLAAEFLYTYTSL